MNVVAAQRKPHRRTDERSAPSLRRYELRIGTALSPPLMASFGHCVSGTVVPRKTVYRIRVGEREHGSPVDLSAVLKRLTECDVDVLDIRICPSPR